MESDGSPGLYGSPNERRPLGQRVSRTGRHWSIDSSELRPLFAEFGISLPQSGPDGAGGLRLASGFVRAIAYGLVERSFDEPRVSENASDALTHALL